MGFPNSTKEAMLQIDLGNAALILELLARLGYFAGDTFSFEALCNAAEIEYIQISPHMIRRGLAQLVENELICWESKASEGRGRPYRLYTMPAWTTIAFKLGIELKEHENHDTPSDSSFKSLKNYRKGLYYVFIQKRPGKYSRRFLGQRLGMGERTTRNYEKGTNIRVTHNWEDEELFSFGVGTPKTRQSGKYFIKSWDSEFKDEKILPLTEFIVRRELGLGRRVFKTWQTTNEYRVA